VVSTWPQKVDGDQDSGHLAEVRDSLESGVRGLARLLEGGPEDPKKGQRIIEAPAEGLLQSETPVCVVRAMDHFRELQMTCHGIVRSAA